MTGKFFNSLFRAMAICMAVGLMASCSDEPELNDDFLRNGKITPAAINLGAVSSDVGGLIDATYTCSGFSMYRLDPRVDSKKWRTVDLTDLTGWENPFPHTMIIKGGECWAPMRMLREAYGPLSFGMALHVLNTARDPDYHVYMKVPVALDPDALRVKVGQLDCTILEAAYKKLALGYESSFFSWDDKKQTTIEGRTLEVGEYTLTEPMEFAATDLRFESTADAYDWLIDRFRTVFGDSVNCNHYLTGVILDHPYLTAEQLEREREQVIESHLYEW